MIPEEFEEISEKSENKKIARDRWFPAKTRIFLAKLSDEFRFSQAPEMYREQQEWIRAIRKMVEKDFPAVSELLPHLKLEKNKIKPHMYYYADFDEFESNPEQTIRAVLRLLYDKSTPDAIGRHKSRSYFSQAEHSHYTKVWNRYSNRKLKKPVLMKPGEILDDNLHGYSTAQLISKHSVFSIQSNWFNFDIGMSFELRSLLGLPQDEYLSVEHFQRRQLYRYWLNGLIRDFVQYSSDEGLGLNTLIHYYTTGRNVSHHGLNYDRLIDEKTGTKPNSILNGWRIAQFGYLFTQPGNELHMIKRPDEKKPSLDLFAFYKWLHDEFGLSQLSLIWPSLIVRTTSKSISEVFNSIPEKEFREFMKTVYRADPIISEKIEKGNAKFLPLNGHDMVAFMLWYCYKTMPWGRQIISTVPPRLNPNAIFWIYSDIIKEEVVSRDFGRLLAVCTTPKNLPAGVLAEVTYNFPIFKTLSTKYLNEIEIFIATSRGNAVPFNDGPSTVQLVFEERP
jgi:hypothetical protein